MVLLKPALRDAKPVNRRLNAVGNAAEADTDPERQRPQRPAEVQNDGGDRRQVAGNGLKFIAGGNGIRQLDELLAQVSFGDGSKLSSEQAANICPGAGFQDVRDQYAVDCGRHKITLQEYHLYENVQVFIFVRKRTNSYICTNTYKLGNRRELSIFVQYRRWVCPAGGRHNAVLAQIEGHLAVVVGGMPKDHGGEAQARVRSGVGTFDRVKHVLCVHRAQRFADGGKRIAQVDQQLFPSSCGVRATFVAAVGRLLAIHLGGEGKIRTGDVLDLFGEGTDLSGTELRFFVFELAFGRAIAVFLLRHGLGGRAHLVFLESDAPEERRGDGFLLAHFGCARCLLRQG